MRPRRGALRAAALGALVAAAAVLGACGRPPDEAWLRIVAIEDAAGGSVATLEAYLEEEETTDSVQLQLENRSSTIGVTDGGTGVLVERLRVESTAGGRALPAREFPVTLYLASGSGSSAADGVDGLAAAGSGSLEVGVVTPALKRWIRENLFVPEGGVEGSTRITVFAVTDDGRGLRTSGGLGLRVTDGPRPSSQ